MRFGELTKASNFFTVGFANFIDGCTSTSSVSFAAISFLKIHFSKLKFNFFLAQIKNVSIESSRDTQNYFYRLLKMVFVHIISICSHINTVQQYKCKIHLNFCSTDQLKWGQQTNCAINCTGETEKCAPKWKKWKHNLNARTKSFHANRTGLKEHTIFIDGTTEQRNDGRIVRSKQWARVYIRILPK